MKSFPGKALPLVVLWFAILIGGATTFSVLHAKDEEQAKAAELKKAGEKFEAVGNDAAAGEAAEEAGGKNAKAGGTSKEAPAEKGASGPGGTVSLAADPTNIAYNSTSLSSKPGKVTIDFTNPSALEHDVAIEENGKEIAASELIAKGKTSVSANLAPGTYTFFCTVPGHREAGMEGTLTVK